MRDRSRRHFLYNNMVGVGGIALLDLMRRDSIVMGAEAAPLAPKQPHHAAKAKSCIFLTMLGGVSQVDTFDPKPTLTRLNDTPLDWSKEKKTDQPNLFAKPRNLVASPFKFS